MTLRKQLQFALAGMLVPLLVAGISQFAVLHRDSEEQRRLSRELVGELDLINHARNLLFVAEGSALQFISGRDKTADGAFAGASRDLKRGFGALIETDEPKQLALAVAAERAWNTARPEGSGAMHAKVVSRRAGAQRGTVSNASSKSSRNEAAPKTLAGGTPSIAGFHKGITRSATLLDRLAVVSAQEIEKATAAYHHHQQVLLLSVAAVFVLGLAGAGLVGGKLHRIIGGPLQDLQEAARRFGDDDLTHRVTVARADELGAVAKTFNAMAERLLASRAELEHQAFHDSLTGLPNRALFSDRTDHALVRARRRNQATALLFLDLDDFKTVNDSLGHSIGDDLLTAVAGRLQSKLRPEDTIARLGGDEFAVLLEDLPEDTYAVEVAERIIDALRPALRLGHMDVVARVSVGVALSGSPSETSEELLRNADVAMYVAKSEGKGRYQVFAPSMHAAVVARLELEGDLRHALDRNEFHLLYQPLLDLQSGGVVGVEALLRWRHPRRGLISPAEFIPAAERTGAIVALGRWVLEQACTQARSWHLSNPLEPPVGISVNLSLRQLREPGLVQEVAEVLSGTQLDPGCLTLEITESVLATDVDTIIALLTQLKALGVLLAVDDFGTGYSSLSYLRRFPIDVLKIDKSFVDGVGSGPFEEAALAHAIIKLGQTLSLKTVAEGIEQGVQAEQLRRLGCHLGQGFLFARPLESEAVAELLGSSSEVLSQSK